jgi:hypothetical protein
VRSIARHAVVRRFDRALAVVGDRGQESGPVGSGRWPVASGQWAVGGGRWAVGGGRWAVKKKPCGAQAASL